LTSPSASRVRTTTIALGIVVAVGLATDLGALRNSMWLDESWVANSVLSPTLRGMLYYDRWAQSTPPLFLILTRAWTAVFGHGELAMRAVAWLAGAGAAIVMAATLARMFTPVLAIAGTSVFVANYYAGKYAQQIKQYSSDLLVATMLLALTWRCLTRRDDRSTGQVIAVGLFCIFLSYTSIFWLPSLVLAVVIARGAGAPLMPRLGREPRLLMRPLAVAAILGAGAMTAVLVFVRPNVVARLAERQEDRFIGSGGMMPSLARFAENVGQLLLPQGNAAATLVSYALATLSLVGLGRLAWLALRGERRARCLLLVAGLPLAVGGVLSVARQYPLLVYPRYVIWMLPALAVLIVAALEGAWQRIADRLGARAEGTPMVVAAVVLGMVPIIGVWAADRLRPERPEDARGVYQRLQSQMQAGDLLYVHGGNTEQFRYYATTRQWTPDRIYWGYSAWPCCPINLEAHVTRPDIRRFDDELVESTRMAASRLWILMPGLEPDTWSAGLIPLVRSVPQRLDALGWRVTAIYRYPGGTLYLCVPR
jgi:hypothetical protein